MNPIEEEKPHPIFIAQTTQMQHIRILINAIKDILTDIPIICSKHGLKITNTDKSHTILVNVDLNNFDEIVCIPDKIIICTRSFHLANLIGMSSNDDIFSMYIDSSDYNDGIVSHLGLQYDNGSIGQRYNLKLRLIKSDLEEMIIPNVDYSAVIHFPSNDLTTIIRNLEKISNHSNRERIEIKLVGGELIFISRGSFSDAVIKRTESEKKLRFVKKPKEGEVIQGFFSIRSLKTLIKCTTLCPHVEIKFSNNLPLTLKYSVSSLGHLSLIIPCLDNFD